jgi:hypothetical protein
MIPIREILESIQREPVIDRWIAVFLVETGA